MGRFQPKAHPRWWKKEWDRTWFYTLIGLLILAFIILMTRL